MSEVEAWFWKLCEQATRHDDAYFRMIGDNSVRPEDANLEAQASEQAMVEIIKLVEANPNHRETFVHCFSEIVLLKRPARYELVAFCMRRLRFPEVLEVIRRDADAHTDTEYYARHMNYWSDIFHAYHDKVWESADCFDFYRHEVDEKET